MSAAEFVGARVISELAVAPEGELAVAPEGDEILSIRFMASFKMSFSSSITQRGKLNNTGIIIGSRAFITLTPTPTPLE